MHRRLLVLALALELGCGGTSLGDGIARLDSTTPEAPTLAGLVITEVYVDESDPTASFVEISNTSAVDIELAGYDLVDPFGADPVTTEASVQIQAGERLSRFGPFDALRPAASVGEVALVDGDGVVQSYLAWGADPSTMAGSWQGAALLSGVTTVGAYVPLPWPMPAGVAVAREGDASGCAAPSDGGAATIDAALCVDGAASVRLNELLPSAGTGSGWVELASEEASPISLYGVRLCVDGTCTVLGRDDAVAGLGYLVPDLNLDLGATAGEVALVRPGAAAITDAAQLLSYVRYGGSATTYFAQLAVDAGEWNGTTAAAVAPTAGESLSFDPLATVGASAWSSATPTPGAAN